MKSPRNTAGKKFPARLAIPLPPELLERLDRIGRRKYKTRAELGREAVVQYLDRIGGEEVAP